MCKHCENIKELRPLNPEYFKGIRSYRGGFEIVTYKGRFWIMDDGTDKEMDKCGFNITNVNYCPMCGRKLTDA